MEGERGNSVVVARAISTSLGSITSPLLLSLELAESSGRISRLPTMGTTCSTITVVSGDGCGSLASRCGISASDFYSYNPSPTLCSTLVVGQKVCCTAGGLPVPSQNADGSCASYLVPAGDSCSAIAASNSITVANLETWNAQTWGWGGCGSLQAGQNICLSTGTPPMPAPVDGTKCGPQVPGTAKPAAGTNLTSLNPCPLNACCDVFVLPRSLPSRCTLLTSHQLGTMRHHG